LGPLSFPGGGPFSYPGRGIVSEELGRVLDELTTMRVEIRETLVAVTQIQEQVKDLPDHEQRLRSLERWKYGFPITGLVAISSLAISAWARVSGK
jgi:hypothetical protein